MLDNSDFTQLMMLTRAGDRDAAQKLVELYEPEIRRVARLRLTDPKLRRIVDSMDICQSVFGKFFNNASGGSELKLDTPEQLLGLLVTMTRNRVVDEHRRQTRKKRGGGEPPVMAEANWLVEDSPGPKTAFEMKDLLLQVRSRLTEDEIQIADLRNAGQTWDEIAVTLAQPADLLRKRFARAMQRVRAQFNEAAE